ncbi:hypothetical protein TgHK011_009360 [Trichoderma gracile]|nr:hypothetical protein TgHK011_009360 [Trichoderma gracile]
MRDIAQPVLYHDVRAVELWLFLRTIMERPDLAAQVQCFHQYDPLIYCGPNDRDETPSSWALEEQKHDWMSRFEGTEALGDADLEKWLLDSILALLPSAKQLIVDMSLNDRYAWAASANFSSITHLVLDHFTLLGDGYLSGFLSTMPRLEKLSIAVTGDTPERLPLAEVSCLEIIGEQLSEAALGAIVSSCPKLERFAYHLGMGREAITWKQVQRSLHQCRKTLRHVEITFKPYYFDDNYNLEYGLGSFRELDRLETLFISAKSFHTDPLNNTVPMFPVDVPQLIGFLPESVRHIKFLGLQRQWDGIGMLAQAVSKGHFPRLKMVQLLQDWTTLRESCSILAAVGVKCESFDQWYC